MRLRSAGRYVVAGVPLAWLLLFFLVPFVIILCISFSQSALSIPPYAPIWEWVGHRVLAVRMHMANYHFLFTDALYVSAFLYSIKVAAISTLLCLLLGYPMAYGIARATPATRNTLLLLVILPFWTSFLLRVYAWIGLLKNNGLINKLLLSLGIIHEPITMMQTDFAVYVGIVYSYLPFMILPLYASLEKINPALLEAAQDLGSRPWRAFWQVTFPLSLPGVFAGCLLVFIPAVGEFVIPDLLGGSETLMIGKTLWTEFFNNRDWPLASAVAVLLLLVLIIPIVLFQRQQQLEREAGR